MLRVSSTTVAFTVNGGAPFNVVNTVPAYGCAPWASVHNGNAAESYFIDLDFMRLKVNVTR